MSHCADLVFEIFEFAFVSVSYFYLFRCHISICFCTIFLFEEMVRQTWVTALKPIRLKTKYEATDSLTFDLNFSLSEVAAGK
jgi:ABC-type thiamin/hydroxymethylpyrimidine transport system permease subunit